MEKEDSSECCGSSTSADSHKVRKANVDGSSKPRISNRLELMDDFLEIEKLAANDPNEANSASRPCNSAWSSDSVDKQSSSKYSEQNDTALDQLLTVLCSRISSVFKSQEGISIEKIAEATSLSIQEMQGSSPKQLSGSVLEDSYSNPLGDNLINGHKMDETSCKSFLKELKQLKLEKDNLENTKVALEEKEQLISEFYFIKGSPELDRNSVEMRDRVIQITRIPLEEETTRLEFAFSTEKRGHEETLAKFKDLQDKMQWNETCRKCSGSKIQHNQKKDIAACQETIHLLSQHLQSLQPQSNHIS